MTKIITLYNNKGGVSKTTTLFNIAAKLSKNGKRVLIADCDPQCNITELFFASSDLLDDPSQDLPGTSIYEALRPRFYGETAKIDPEKVTLVKNTRYSNLYLLKGDFELATAESYFANAWNQAITDNVNEKNTYMALYNLLQGLGQKENFDYILCDVGPSTGALTRMVVLACDGFFLPLTPDRFCNQAVKILGKLLREWMEKHKKISNSFEPFGLSCFPGNPIFLGSILQNFKINREAKAKESYKKWQVAINESIQLYIFDNGVTIAPSVNKGYSFVAEIRDVGTLAPVSQMYGCAIFDIEQSYTSEASTTGQPYYGAVWQTWLDRMGPYEIEIEKIVGALP
jgi:chromosome partitioning protein